MNVLFELRNHFMFCLTNVLGTIVMFFTTLRTSTWSYCVADSSYGTLHFLAVLVKFLHCYDYITGEQLLSS